MDPTEAYFSWLACCSRNRAARGAPTPSQPPRGFCSGCFSSLGVMAVLHAELYALLDLQPQQKPPPLDSHPERQPPASHAPAGHAPADQVHPAHAEPTKCGQAAQGEDDLLSPQFSARPQCHPFDETELGERQYGEWSLRTVRPVRRGTSAPCGERRCGTCLVAIGSDDATIFMALDRPFCSAACQMCMPCPLAP